AAASPPLPGATPRIVVAIVIPVIVRKLRRSCWAVDGAPLRMTAVLPERSCRSGGRSSGKSVDRKPFQGRPWAHAERSRSKPRRQDIVVKENEMSWLVRRMIVLSLALAIGVSAGGWASAPETAPSAQAPGHGPPQAGRGGAG